MTDTYSTDVDDFLAHYGVLGMHWGKRKAQKLADNQARADIMRGKDLDQRKFRNDQEKKLHRLLQEDIEPKRTAGKDFGNHLLKENGLTLSGIGLTAAGTAAGVAFMALRLNSKFKGISMSAFPMQPPVTWR